MSRVSITAPHLSAEAIKQKIKSAGSYWHRQKWLVVYNGLVNPRPASEIAQHTGVSVGTVHKVISQYNRLGADALALPGKGGRRNQYLTLEQEKAFVATFKEKAARGQIATIAEIKLAYEKLVGHPVDIALRSQVKTYDRGNEHPETLCLPLTVRTCAKKRSLR